MLASSTVLDSRIRPTAAQVAAEPHWLLLVQAVPGSLARGRGGRGAPSGALDPFFDPPGLDQREVLHVGGPVLLPGYGVSLVRFLVQSFELLARRQEQRQ